MKTVEELLLIERKKHKLNNSQKDTKAMLYWMLVKGQINCIEYLKSVDNLRS